MMNMKFENAVKTYGYGVAASMYFTNQLPFAKTDIPDICDPEPKNVTKDVRYA